MKDKLAAWQDSQEMGLRHKFSVCSTKGTYDFGVEEPWQSRIDAAIPLNCIAPVTAR